MLRRVTHGVWNATSKRYYLLNEKDDGQIGLYDPKWRPKGTASSHGAAPCYVSLNAAQTHLAVANYTSGNIAVYQIGADGGLGEPVTRQNSGTGPNKERQEGPHAHWVQFSPDQAHIYSIDLGTDQILGYSFDEKTGAVGDTFVAFQAPPGSGPRHVAFHPDQKTAFLVTEMGNLALVLKRGEDGKFTAVQTLSTLPADFTAHSQAAHIVLNKAADRLYVSNRGHNSIAVFAVAKDGTLSLLQIASTTGDWPRFFLLLEAQKRVVVAHQNGNDLVVFTLKDDGTLTPRDQRISVSQPVFIGAVA